MKKATAVLAILAVSAALTFPASATSAAPTATAPKTPTTVSKTVAEKSSAPVLKAAAVSSTRINLSWSKVDGAVTYDLYISPDDQGSEFKRLDGTAKLNYTVTNLTPATRYKFKIVPVGKTAKGQQPAVVKAATGGYYQKGLVSTDDQSKGEYKESNTFDAGGNLLTRDVSFGNTGITYQDQYTYDDKGNLLTSKEHSSGGWAYQYAYTYDEKGNIASQTRLLDDGSVDYKVTFTYNANGKELTSTQTNAKGDVTSTVTNTYDSAGNVITSDTKNSSGLENVKYSFTYDKYGNRLTVTKNGKVSDTYTYDVQGNILSHTNNSGGAKEVYTYKLPLNAGVVSSFTTYGEDGKVTGNSVYTYDNYNNQLTDTSYDAKGATERKIVNTYDTNGNNLTTELFNADGTSASKTTFTYDTKGNVLTATVSENGKVTSKTTYVY
ncbi:hypothetical protein FACS1894120_2400 [Clostridia bacterium]|nr:hypothetical protein FACS1894120_2400 [Clostridia bacterium]